MLITHRPHRISHAQIEHDCRNVLDACVRLSQAGCQLLAGHAAGGMLGIVVDRRPPLPDLTPGCLRADAYGVHYQASLNGVRIGWVEPRAYRGPRP